MDEEIKFREFTDELNEVVKYMETTLINEFPSPTLHVEHLIQSIFDQQNCHANKILDNTLMSDTLSDLKKAYVESLSERSDFLADASSAKRDQELERLFQLADAEADKTKSEKLGTEHVLLAILNDDNGISAGNVLKRFNLSYNSILTKCSVDETAPKQHKRAVKRPSFPKEPITPKSQVNGATATKTDSNEYVSKYTKNISRMAENGEIQKIVGRETEIREMIRILARMNKNNVILVGNGGCGKTKLAYAIADIIAKGDVPSVIQGKEVVTLDPMALISGTQLRGMFEERVNNLFTELSNSNRYILIIDDIHNVLKNGSRDRDTDIGGMIGDILANGAVRVIATTTDKGYRNAIESNSSISRKFQKIEVEPPSVNETINILMSCKEYYERYHNVFYTKEVVDRIVALSNRYITSRCLPDSAFDVMDLCGANTVLFENEPHEIQESRRRLSELIRLKTESLNKGDFETADSVIHEENELTAKIEDYQRNARKTRVEITDNDVDKVVSDMTMIPVSKLSTDDKGKLLNIAETLKMSVVGQDESIDEVAKVIKRNRIGLGDHNKTNGVFLLIGPSGVGKTLLAKMVAKEVYGDENALIRIDMSEYSEKNSVSKLQGTSQGYIGYEDGGVLTNSIKKKPYSVVLLDEIEKADESIYNLFLQVFDEGRISESNGNIVNCKNCIFFMTSNVGARKANDLGRGIGFSTNENKNKKSIYSKELKRKFTPEFLNRINKILYFNSLSEENIKSITKLELNKLTKKLNDINYDIVCSDEVVTYIQTKANEEKEYGARPIARIIQDNIEDAVTELILANDYKGKYTFSASCSGDKITIV